MERGEEMKLAYPAAIVLALSGCATVAPQASVARIPPSSLLEPCQSLPMAQSGKLKDLVQNHIEVVESATLCAEGKRALIEWEKQRLKDDGVDVK